MLHQMDFTFPGEYVAFTKTVDEIINHYKPATPNQILKISSMPAYSNNEGIVVLQLQQELYSMS